MTDFADWIRDVRTARGLTPDQFAGVVGCTTQTVYNWEAGTYAPLGLGMQRIANTLRLALPALVHRADPWTAAKIDRLRELWAEGLSAAAIGRELKMSKNAIVGKAHRLGLPDRPSPIRRGVTPSAKPPRVTGPTLPPLPSAVLKPARTPATRATPKPAPAPRPAFQTSVTYPREMTCQYPFGEPGHEGFRFCGAPREDKRPYCAQHVAFCYHQPGHIDAERAADA